jgi:hypothetical protein
LWRALSLDELESPDLSIRILLTEVACTLHAPRPANKPEAATGAFPDNELVVPRVGPQFAGMGSAASQLELPCHVTGIEDFHWEERYLMGAGRHFFLGLSELEVVEQASRNHQLLDDYAVGFVNSR